MMTDIMVHRTEGAISIRTMTENDQPDYIAWMSSAPGVQAYVQTSADRGCPVTEEFYAKNFGLNGITFIVVENCSGNSIGFCNIALPPPFEPTVCVYIHPSYRSKGYGYLAMKMAIEECWKIFDQPYYILECKDFDVAGKRIAEKLGGKFLAKSISFVDVFTQYILEPDCEDPVLHATPSVRYTIERPDMKGKIMYSEPVDYFPPELRKKHKLGEFADPVDDYCEEKTCVYKGEVYLVRDNGAVLRKPKTNRIRKLDNKWTFGEMDLRGYSVIGSERVHLIVATAFYGARSTIEYVVDHIDSNKQNNRPSNLRWVTRFENAVLNEATRKKIEFKTGVSIFEFLENPAAYRHRLDTPDVEWMRVVSEEEAKNCLENMKKWAALESVPPEKQNPSRKIGEWIYQPHSPTTGSCPPTHTPPAHTPPSNIIDSLTALAKQKDWTTPTQFNCCPDEIVGDPIDCYFKQLSEGAFFATNQYGESTILKVAITPNHEIVAITTTSSIKPYAVAKITFENGYYLHSSLGSFFDEKGAEKHFTLAQGLPWLGGDSIDDYC